MDALSPFRIPVASLKADEAHYEWELGSDFLRLFDDEHEAEKGLFAVNLDIEKLGGVSTFTFRIKGEVQTICDRCLAPIAMPVEGEYEVILKFGDPNESTDDVIVLDPESNGFNIGKQIYDFILLSVPIFRRIPGCGSSPNPPCDMTILSYLSEQTEIEKPKQEDDDLLWGDLRKAIDN
ncbi:MAG: DUF177 domain-containing protein [Bacteroidota bacterium]|nr:DUF177 domain-containing protein [Bacteroidota bacterium]